MNYNDILNDIFTAYPMYHKVGSSAYKEGLENIEQLLSILELPQQNFNTIHVAGTNGKGSVASLLASYYYELGYKTALFTSPHLVDFTERIRINGLPIPKPTVVAFFEKYQSSFASLQPSFFEITTALAFKYFADEKVDIAIIEVGLGGRLDSTNVIHPLLSIITNISLDHTQLLGYTIEQIAAEKAGIIKNNIPAVVGRYQPECASVFETVAKQKNAPLYFSKHYSIQLDEDFYQHPSYRLISIFKDDVLLYSHVKCPLLGDYQFENIITFLTALSVLSALMPLKNELIVAAIENVLVNTHFFGRWHLLSQSPLAICDVGHNIGGFLYTMKQLQCIPCQQLHFVIGFVSDKDVDKIIAVLPPQAVYYVCQANIPRALSASFLLQKLEKEGFKVVYGGNVADAYSLALKNASSNDLVFVGGSCFVVGDLLAAYPLYSKEIRL